MKRKSQIWIKNKTRKTRHYHHILTARFRVRLADEPVETTALYVLKNLACFLQLRLTWIQDAEEDAVIYPRICNHVIDCLWQLQHLTVQQPLTSDAWFFPYSS